MKKGNIQEWIHFKSITKNGLIIQKDNSYIKIIKVKPINYNLKSELEKNAIINSYKLFLKTCDFPVQIIIQTIKENIHQHLKNIEKEQEKIENKPINNLYEKYSKFIQQKIQNQNSTKKVFYILINNSIKNNIDEKNIEKQLNEKYYKIKECLNRCGNQIEEITDQKEIEKILYSFYNYTEYEVQN